MEVDILMNKKKYNSIDLWKFIMAFAVVAIHTHPLENINNESIQKIYTIFVTMAVPFFFLASGYLMAVKMTWDGAENDLEKIKKQLLRITKMYLIWTLVYLPLAVYHFISTATKPIEAVLTYIAKFLFVGEQYNSWPLWFLLSSIYSLIVILFFIKKFKKPEYLIILSAVASIICVGVIAFAYYEGTYSPALENLRPFVMLTTGTARLFQGLVYIPIGMLLSRKKLPTALSVLMLLAAGIVHFFVNNEYVSGYLTIMASIGLFGLIECLSLKDNAIYAKLRTYSTIIYLIHMYIWTFYYMIVYGQKTYGADGFLVTSALALVIAILYSFIRRSKS